MKFWFSPHKNFTDRVGRFVYDTAPQNSGSCSNHEIFAEKEEDRQAAVDDTHLALDDLRGLIETNDGIENLSTSEKLGMLLRIARNEAAYDDEDDERRNLSKVRDLSGALVEKGLSLFGDTGEAFAREAQERLNFSSEAYIIKILEEDEILTRFLADYQADSFNLFTDYQGSKNGSPTYRAKFYGNKKLEDQATFIEMLPNDNDHKYLVMGEETYVRTPYGYTGFFPDSVLGNRAKIGSNTVFSVRCDLDPGSDEAETLDHLKDTHDYFKNIDDAKSLGELESNRGINYQTTLIWKDFMNEINGNRLLNAMSPEINNLVKTPFKHFLDGNFFVDDVINESGDSFSIPGVEGVVPPLTADMDPADYRARIDKALTLMQDFLFKILSDAQEEIAAVKQNPGSWRNSLKIEQLELKISVIKDARSNYFNATENFIESSEVAHQGSLDANAEQFAEDVDESLTSEEVTEMINMFDTNIRELIENQQYSENTAIAIAEQLIGNLAASKNGTLSADKQNTLIDLMHARINIMAKEPGFRHLAASNNLRIARSEIFSQAQRNPSINRLLQNSGITKPSDLTSEKLEVLVTELNAIIQNSENLEPSKTEILRRFATRIQDYANTIKSEEQAVDKAIEDSSQTEQRLMATSETYAGIVDTATNEGTAFRERVQVQAVFIANHIQQNNGQRPNLEIEDIIQMRQMHEDGASSGDLSSFLSHQNAKRSNQALSSNQTPSAPVNNEYTTHQGLNIVGTTADGQNIVEIPGSSNDRFIQDPNDNTFIAEKFANVPDREDLKTGNLYLAQIYNAFTNGGVVQSPLRNIAQAAEKSGSVATTKLISNYLIGANRSETYTMTPNEALQWEQLGQMCGDCNIGIDTVFARLSGAPRMDGRVNSNPTDNGTLLVQMLETATAGNRNGFEDLMGINTPNRLD